MYNSGIKYLKTMIKEYRELRDISWDHIRLNDLLEDLDHLLVKFNQPEKND